MSGETEKQVSGWTVDTLKEYVEQKFVAADKAIGTANTANEKRLDAVNEFRNQQKDIIATFLPRAEYDARHETLVNSVTELTDRMNRNDGKSVGSDITMNKIYGAIAAAVGLMILASYLFE